MSVPFLIAALLATVAFLGHGLGGELRKLKDLQGTSLPDTDKLELRAAWHVVTLTLLWSSITLFVVAFSDFIEHPDTVGEFIALLFFGYSLIWAWIVATTRVTMLLRLPQWIVALGVAGFSWWGTL